MPLDPALHVRPLADGDRPEWEALARGYKDFYGTPTTDAEYRAAWDRLRAGGASPLRALVATVDDRVVGLAHYLFHASAWATSVCYLQDLFTAPEARGQGVARALIAAVADDARGRGAQRFYWLTQSHNEVARALYDRVAEHRGFIRYDHPLSS